MASRYTGNCLSREIPGESVKGDGGNENHQPQNCCEFDWYALAVRPFAEQTHFRLSPDTNESAPDSVESRDASLDQPSPESCSQPPYAPILTGGMAPTGHCGKCAPPLPRYFRTSPSRPLIPESAAFLIEQLVQDKRHHVCLSACRLASIRGILENVPHSLTGPDLPVAVGIPAS